MVIDGWEVYCVEKDVRCFYVVCVLLFFVFDWENGGSGIVGFNGWPCFGSMGVEIMGWRRGTLVTRHVFVWSAVGV